MSSKEYPESYTGPKAGQSTHEEWIAVRDFDAFKYMRDFTWSYSDFDNYLYSMCEMYYQAGRKKGMEESVEALKEFQKLTQRTV